MQGRPYPSSPGPLYQNDWCSAIDMEMIFHSHANETYFHKKGCAHDLILKMRVLDLGISLLPLKICESETGLEEGQLFRNILTGTR